MVSGGVGERKGYSFYSCAMRSAQVCGTQNIHLWHLVFFPLSSALFHCPGPSCLKTALPVTQVKSLCMLTDHALSTEQSTGLNTLKIWPLGLLGAKVISPGPENPPGSHIPIPVSFSSIHCCASLWIPAAVFMVWILVLPLCEGDQKS